MTSGDTPRAYASPPRYDAGHRRHAVPPSAHTIVNVGYRSTNYYVISAGASRLLVDLGWPGTLPALRWNLERKGIALPEIRYALATHYHMDHAGLAQELKDAGVPLVVIAGQESAIPRMRQWMKPADRFVDISIAGNVVIPVEASRGLLAGIGVLGEVVPTPGHSDDSVSLLLDDGSAFTGDLPPVSMASEAEASAVGASWARLRERGATTIYPGHGPVRQML